jgi:hypothetical protein
MGAEIWLMLIGGAIGAGVAIHGFVAVTFGRSARGDEGVFRRDTAGLYYLCFGLALVSLTVAALLNRQDQTVLAIGAVAAAMLLTGVAVVRYRPRGGKRP